MNGIQPGNVTIDDPLIRTPTTFRDILKPASIVTRSEEHTSELQSRSDLVCRLLLEKKKTTIRRWIANWCCISTRRTNSTVQALPVELGGRPHGPPRLPNVLCTTEQHWRSAGITSL